MNKIIEELYERKSTRIFTDKAISAQAKSSIIQSAIQAPTAGNQMLYTILDITDQNLKEKLSVSCDNQPFIATAPLVLIFLADCRKWLDTYTYAGANPRKPEAGDMLLACCDALIAAQNAVVAAWSLGIGSCYIGDILENYEIHKDMLGLDKYTIPVSMVVFGYPTKQQIDRKKPARFDEKFIVQENTYAPLSESNLREMFADRAKDETFDYDSYIQKFCDRKYMSDFSKEMSASVKKYINNFL